MHERFMGGPMCAAALAIAIALGGAATAQAQAGTAQAGASPTIVYAQAQPQPQPQPQVVYVQPQPYGAQGVMVAQPVAQPMGTPREVSRPNLGLIISGAVMLGVGWLVNILISLPAGDDPFSSASTEAWDAFRFSSFVPIAGPWIQLGVKPTGFTDDYWSVWLLIDGLLQGAGTIMLIAGLASPSVETVYADAETGFELAIAPSIGPSHTGLTLSGRF